jgi:hypothetical protein
MVVTSEVESEIRRELEAAARREAVEKAAAPPTLVRGAQPHRTLRLNPASHLPTRLKLTGHFTLLSNPHVAFVVKHRLSTKERQRGEHGLTAANIVR